MALIPATAKPKPSVCQRLCLLKGSGLNGHNEVLDIGYEKEEEGRTNRSGRKIFHPIKTCLRIDVKLCT